jgi:hypothetical protein
MLIRCRRISRTGTKFYVTWKNILAVTVLFNDKCRQMTEWPMTIFKHFKIEIKNSKILNPSADDKKVPSYTVKLSNRRTISWDYPFKFLKIISYAKPICNWYVLRVEHA